MFFTHDSADAVTICQHTHVRFIQRVPLSQPLYLDAGVAGLRLGLDADVPSAVLLAIPARVVARVPTLVGDDGRDGLGRIGLDEEPVERGCVALRDGGGLVGGVGFV